MATKKTKKVEYKGLPAAERLLAAVNEAMENVDEIVKCTDEWQQEDSNYPSAPPLLKQSASWSDAVDKGTYDKFQKLVGFLTDALFGVDCDSDSAVRFQFVNMAQEENFLPRVTVKRVRYEAPLDKRLYQVELVKMIRDSVQERLNTMERTLDQDIKKVVRRDCIEQRARGCRVCKGKGWVETDKATWEALDYGERCRTSEIGCNYQRGSTGPYRLFCACQKNDDIDAEGDSDVE